jgi:tetratricopeptide (TPR) repeat protein
VQHSARPADLAAQADRLLGTGQLDDAIRLYEAALAADPRLPDAWFNLGWALRSRRRFEAALQAYGEALRQGVRQPEEAQLNRAAIFSDHLYAHDAAVEELKTALANAPDFIPALLSLGTVYEDLGNADLAREVYQRVLRSAQGNGRATARLAMIDLAEGNHNAALVAVEAALPRASNPADGAEILFAKAAALDADAQYDAAFDTLMMANGLARTVAHNHYDPAAHEAFVTRLIQAFPEACARFTDSNPALEPIFIVGMFRSGSTLTEQILARHPVVTAGGELEYIPAIARADLAPYPEAVAQLDDAAISAFRQNYLSELARAATSGRVTDKRCDNIQHLGLIDFLFPGMPIIHTVRDPLDTLVSVLFLHFGEAVSYGHNQRDAAHYYGQYRRLLSHWRKIFGTRIHDIDYDRLVVDPKREIEKALTFLGLPWDDACLGSTANTQSIRTASSWQIRKPLHRQSSGRWTHYAKQLEPARQMLIDAGYL